MIAGETENILGSNEDSFYAYDELFGGKGKAKRQARKVQRVASKGRDQKEKGKKKFFKGIGNAIKDNGGLQGVSSTLGNVVGMFKNNPVPAEASDYQVAVGQTQLIGEDKKITPSMYLVGGAVVLGLVVFGVTKLSKNKS